MAHAGWRQLAAYAAVAFGGIASLATSYGPEDEQASLEGTVFASKGAEVRRRFRVRTNAPWTTVSAEVTTIGPDSVKFRVRLVPDDPARFGTDGAAASAFVKVGISREVEIGQPPCAATTAGCKAGEPEGMNEYRFALVFDGLSDDATLRYTVTLGTSASRKGDEYGLELVAE